MNRSRRDRLDDLHNRLRSRRKARQLAHHLERIAAALEADENARQAPTWPLPSR